MKIHTNEGSTAGLVVFHVYESFIAFFCKVDVIISVCFNIVETFVHSQHKNHKDSVLQSKLVKFIDPIKRKVGH